MALELNNYVTIPVQATTSPVGIYTAPAGYNSVVLCAQATNLDSVSQGCNSFFGEGGCWGCGYNSFCI